MKFCISCKKENLGEYLRCADCLERQRVNARRWREKRKESNSCRNCSSKELTSSYYCKSCLEKQRLKQKKYKESGYCMDCGSNYSADGKSRCEICLIKRRERRKLNKQNGICVQCGKCAVKSNASQQCSKCLIKRRKVRENAIKNKICCGCLKNKTNNTHYCDICLKSFREKKNNFKDKGLCIYCGEKRINNRSHCQKCYLKSISRSCFGSGEKWNDILDLFAEQGGICPYSGIKLVLGVNTDLDHRIPKSKGGTNTIDNLQWVYSDINKMKWGNEEKEFFRLVRLICDYRNL